MKLEAIVQAVKTQLDTYARDNKGRVSVARDPFDVLEMLTIGPEGFLLVLHDAGDEVEEIGLGEDEGIPQPVRERIELIVGYGLGLGVNTDWRLIAGKGPRPGLLKHCRLARARVLALVFPDDEEQLHRFRYDGREPIATPEGIPLAAYKLKFSIVTSVDVDADIQVEG